MSLEIGLQIEIVELVGDAIRDWPDKERDRGVLDACNTSKYEPRVGADHRPETNSDVSMRGMMLPSA